MKKFILLLFVSAFAISVNAAKVETVETYSDAMKKKINAIVITPDNYAKGTQYPVVYLLHGAGGDYTDWTKKSAGVPENADKYNMIIVCPDGGVTSWYWDAPADPTYKYETYITKELIPFIDKTYKTIKTRNGRAISGLSMGGHGGLWLSIRHQDLFGAGGSMSGGVDIRPFPNNWDMAKRLGSLKDNAETWNKYTVTNQLDLLKPNSLAIIFDCGTEDFFYKVNIELHDKLLALKIPHDFTVRPGAHNWTYWTNSVGYQMLYFSNYFKKSNSAK